MIEMLDWSNIRYIHIKYDDDGSWYLATHKSDIVPGRTFKIIAMKFKDSDIIERDEEGL